MLAPPSPAELKVLRLLATDLTAREIAAQLYLSANTVRSHTRALYRKLGVRTRADAVARAAKLGLLEQTESPRWFLDGTRRPLQARANGGGMPVCDYRVVVDGELSNDIGRAFEGMSLSREEGRTVLVGTMRDQAQLQGVLQRISDLGLTLLSVSALDDEPSTWRRRPVSIHPDDPETKPAVVSMQV
jgi:DNA-binding CsgD family transcriptional regulator